MKISNYKLSHSDKVSSYQQFYELLYKKKLGHLIDRL